MPSFPPAICCGEGDSGNVPVLQLPLPPPFGGFTVQPVIRTAEAGTEAHPANCGASAETDNVQFLVRSPWDRPMTAFTEAAVAPAPSGSVAAKLSVPGETPNELIWVGCPAAMTARRFLRLAGRQGRSHAH